MTQQKWISSIDLSGPEQRLTGCFPPSTTNHTGCKSHSNQCFLSEARRSVCALSVTDWFRCHTVKTQFFSRIKYKRNFQHHAESAASGGMNFDANRLCSVFMPIMFRPETVCWGGAPQHRKRINTIWWHRILFRTSFQPKQALLLHRTMNTSNLSQTWAHLQDFSNFPLSFELFIFSLCFPVWK